MPLLQLIFSILVTVCFLWMVFLLSWYIALPLLVIWAVFGGARWIYGKIQEMRYQRAANGCTIRRTTRSDPTDTVIDADYTEIN